jgi:hypothetical protein
MPSHCYTAAFATNKAQLAHADEQGIDSGTYAQQAGVLITSPPRNRLEIDLGYIFFFFTEPLINLMELQHVSSLAVLAI